MAMAGTLICNMARYTVCKKGTFNIFSRGAFSLIHYYTSILNTVGNKTFSFQSKLRYKTNSRD